MVINLDGPLCNCGRRGCWEAIASGTAITDQVKQLIESEQLTGIANAGCNRIIGPQEVGEAARKGDMKAKMLIENVAYYLGIGIANLINIFNPQVIVLGGGVAMGWQDLLEKPLNNIIYHNVFALHKQELSIKFTSLREQVGLYGGLAFILHKIRG